MAVNTNAPTHAEVKAVEKVLSEAIDPILLADGYWVTLAEDVLEAARDARLQEFIREVDGLDGDPLYHALGEGRR